MIMDVLKPEIDKPAPWDMLSSDDIMLIVGKKLSWGDGDEMKYRSFKISKK